MKQAVEGSDHLKSLKQGRGLDPLPRIGIFLVMTTAATPDLHTFEHHWQDEADAAFLYRALADVEPDAKKKDVSGSLAFERFEAHLTPKANRKTTGDAAALAAALGEVLDDADLRARLIAAGEEAVAPYDWSAIVAQVLRVYELAIAGAGVGA